MCYYKLLIEVIENMGAVKNYSPYNFNYLVVLESKDVMWIIGIDDLTNETPIVLERKYNLTDENVVNQVLLDIKNTWDLDTSKLEKLEELIYNSSMMAQFSKRSYSEVVNISRKSLNGNSTGFSLNKSNFSAKSIFDTVIKFREIKASKESQTNDETQISGNWVGARLYPPIFIFDKNVRKLNNEGNEIIKRFNYTIGDNKYDFIITRNGIILFNAINIDKNNFVIIIINKFLFSLLEAIDTIDSYFYADIWKEHDLMRADLITEQNTILIRSKRVTSGSVEAKYEISKDNPFSLRTFEVEEIDIIFNRIKEISDFKFEINFMLNASKRNLSEDNFLASFVQCWWLIEKYIELIKQKFLSNFEIDQDGHDNIFSKDLIKDNSNWTINLNMQLLVLTNQIEQDDFCDMNNIRSFRNLILHSDRGDKDRSISKIYFNELPKHANLSYNLVNDLFWKYFDNNPHD